MSETKCQPLSVYILAYVHFILQPRDRGASSLKNRKVELGYLIDDDFQRNYYYNIGIEDDMTPSDYRNRYSKEAELVK
jgi:hypothetical protein